MSSSSASARPCACLGSLQPGPTRRVVHQAPPGMCVLTWDDGEQVSIGPVGRCPRCATFSSLHPEVCSGCTYRARWSSSL